MAQYEYILPGNIDEALNIFAAKKGKFQILGGGSDLLIRIKDEKESVDYLLDIASLNLDYIQEQDQGIAIGAMTSLSKIMDSTTINEKYEILSETAKEVGGFQTRNIGTIGGNICTGLPSADMAIPLLVREAKLKINGLEGESIIPIDEFFLEPRKTKLPENALLKEILIEESTGEGSQGSSYIKIGKRKAMRLCILSAGVNIFIDPKTKIINKIRIAMGTVAPIPLRLYKVEEVMTGKEYSEELIKEAISVMEGVIQPRTSLRATCEYRTDLARVLLKRTVQKSVMRAIDGGGVNAN